MPEESNDVGGVTPDPIIPAVPHGRTAEDGPIDRLVGIYKTAPGPFVLDTVFTRLIGTGWLLRAVYIKSREVAVNRIEIAAKGYTGSARFRFEKSELVEFEESGQHYKPIHPPYGMTLETEPLLAKAAIVAVKWLFDRNLLPEHCELQVVKRNNRGRNNIMILPEPFDPHLPSARLVVNDSGQILSAGSYRSSK